MMGHVIVCEVMAVLCKQVVSLQVPPPAALGLACPTWPVRHLLTVKVTHARANPVT
jgi:hypothetical protein